MTLPAVFSIKEKRFKAEKLKGKFCVCKFEFEVSALTNEASLFKKMGVIGPDAVAYACNPSALGD